jgi:prepilin-type N-terminal cleavage/methylation domain-containing protein
MKNKKGFTLIELLVVVLIIGILAAIALPQYQKAVEKFRAAEAFTILKAIASANEIYRLTTGTYASEMEDLDIEIPGNVVTFNSNKRIETKSFVYNTHGSDSINTYIAVAQRKPAGTLYYLAVRPGKTLILCYYYSERGKTLCGYLGDSVETR